MELCSIASGSSGNCIYVGNRCTSLLIDAGISCKRIESGLSEIDVNPEKLDGILVTHEHSDHVLGLGVMARRYHVPIYATAETLSALSRIKSLGKIDPGLFRIIEPNQSFEIHDVIVNPFSISHDAANPVCYTIEQNGHKVGVATDLGIYDDYIVESLKNSEILLLEANHDINMLQVGAYPYVLKRRILGERGHLSNDNCGRLIRNLLHDKLRYIYLGHLSKENNYPDLAYETVKYELDQSDSPFKNNFLLEVAKREEPSVLVSL
ncbi:MBL fold metallo-hydrolase [Anaeromicropila populeti]|uniref:Phosphoribosyl 1,2-cyclic phosphodiesterase n=1 Tax=Anaeromicropila populeti TaxID=37658 RepID=A0A1I6KXV0_9FIRM|nr:MBL fold metallo-hydrolase [Anaeromicropila populeti]SFR96049.1 Phosphoribosyl 1,2-cyclic phosphodiesterase [Anaeromicropila populeti]